MAAEAAGSGHMVSAVQKNAGTQCAFFFLIVSTGTSGSEMSRGGPPLIDWVISLQINLGGHSQTQRYIS